MDEPLSELRSGTSGYYEQDGLGSVTSLSSSTGSLANTYAYGGFGNLASTTGIAVNPFQYTGRDNDPETGLRYYRARYYDSSTGDFLTEDPLGFGGGRNFYTYVSNSPTNVTDPSGLCPPDDTKKKCLVVPEFPAGVNLLDNIKEAERSRWLILAVPRLLWFYAQVRNMRYREVE